MIHDLSVFRNDDFPWGEPVIHEHLQGDGEIDRCREFFAMRRRREVTKEALLMAYHGQFDLSAMPSWLSDKAFAFFLPALLKAAIEGQDQTETQLPDLASRLGHELLGLAKDGLTSTRLALIVKTHTHEQLAYIAQSLKELRDHDKNAWPEGHVEEWEPAAEALRLFWGQFLPAEGGS